MADLTAVITEPKQTASNFGARAKCAAWSPISVRPSCGTVRRILRTAALLIGLTLILEQSGAATSAAETSVAEQPAVSRPNLLFIFADDLTFDALGVMGHPQVKTPNLDQLVRRGTTFTHAYNMGSWSGAVCIASRAMLNTGRQLWHAELAQRRMDDELVAGRLWSEQLRRAGYRTYMTGKWHVNLDPRRAFDVVGHVRPGMPEQTLAGYNRPPADRPDPWSPTDPAWGGYWEGGKHWSEVLADDAEQFFREAASSDQPFFMYLAFNAPHDPRQSPARFVNMYPHDTIQLP